MSTARRRVSILLRGSGRWRGCLTKDGVLLGVILFAISSDQSSKVVIVNLVLEGHHKVAPPLLADPRLHLILVQFA